MMPIALMKLWFIVFALVFTDITSTPGGATVAAKTVRINRDSNERITSIVDPAGNAIRYGQSARGNLTAVTDREENTSKFFYENASYAHYLTRIQDPRGPGFVPLKNIYDDGGRLIATEDALGRQTTIEHDTVDDANGKREIITDRKGNQSIVTYDGYGNVTQTLRPLKDADGSVIRWVKSTTEYADSVNPEQPTKTTQYLTQNDGSVQTLVSRFTYDSKGNITSVTDPLGRITRSTWENGRLKTVTDALNRVVMNNTYNAKGQLTQSADAAGQLTTYTYFANGAPQTVTVGSGANVSTTTYALNAKGEIGSVKDALNHVTSFGYDLNGNRTTTSTTRTKAGGVSETLLTTTEYDADDRPIRNVAPDGVKSLTVYNALGKVAYSVQAEGTGLARTTSYEYNTLGERIKTFYPDGTSTRSSYNALGQVENSYDRTGRISRSVYDSLSRLTKSQSLNAQGEPIRDSAGNALYSETRYDDLGRVTATRDERGQSHQNRLRRTQSRLAHDGRQRSCHNHDFRQRGSRHTHHVYRWHHHHNHI